MYDVSINKDMSHVTVEAKRSRALSPERSTAISFPDENVPPPAEVKESTVDLSGDKVLHVSSLGGLKTVMTSARVVMLKFGAEWCGPCKAMAPHFKTLAKEYPKFKFVSVDTDEAPDVATSFSIESLPTLIILNKGKEEIRVTGSKCVPEIKKFCLERYNVYHPR